MMETLNHDPNREDEMGDRRLTVIPKEEHDGLLKATLESRAEVVRLESQIATLTAQRDALLAACQRALSAYDLAYTGFRGATWSGQDVDAMRAAVVLCSPAAPAKIELPDEGWDVT